MFTPFTTHASGSISAAIRADGASDSGNTASAGALTFARKRAVPEDAERTDVLAARRPAGAARTTHAALRIGIDRHPLTDRERHAAFAPTRADPADELVAHHDAGVGRVARRHVEDLQVGAADPARLDLDDDVVIGLDPGLRDVLELDDALALEDGGAHQARLMQAGRRGGAAGERRDRPSASPAMPEDQQRRDEHHRADRVDLGRHAELDLRVDVGRQRRLVADREPGDDELVDRERDADQRAGQDRRRDQRQHDVPERPSRRGAEVGRRPFELPIEALQARGDDQDDERDRDDELPGDDGHQRQVRVDSAREKKTSRAIADQDARDHDRQREDDADAVREAEPPADEDEGRHRPDDRRQDRRR